MYLKFFLMLFAGYLPAYMILVFFLKTKIKKYTMRSHVVSLLATGRKPWGMVFNTTTALYGLLSIILPISVIWILGINIFTILGALSLLTVGWATILVGIFPMDKKAQTHELVSRISFVSVLLVGLIFLWIFNSNNFMLIIKILNILIVIVTILLCINAAVKKRTNPVLEWLSFMGTIIWNFLLAVSFLIMLANIA